MMYFGFALAAFYLFGILWATFRSTQNIAKEFGWFCGINMVCLMFGFSLAWPFMRCSNVSENSKCVLDIVFV